jgi:hypothetical protein
MMRMIRSAGLVFLMLTACGVLSVRLGAVKLDNCPVGYPNDCTCTSAPWFGVRFTMECETTDGCNDFWHNTDEACTYDCYTPFGYETSSCDDTGSGTVAECDLCYDSPTPVGR